MDLLLLEKILLALFFAIVVAITISKLRGKRFKLPPGPIPVPVFGNWLQVGDDLNHRNLTDLAKKFGDVLMLRMGQRNLVVVSSPDLAKDVLHTQGVEFGSRTRNVVFDIFTGKGQDMVFTVYGEHWRKMRRIMTVPFFTNKVVQQYRYGWEDEAARVVEDVKKNPEAATTGIVLRRRLQLMMYNNMYRIMFDRRFESEEDPLFVKLKALNGEATMKIKEATFPWLDLCYMACGRFRRSDSGRPYIKCNDCGVRFIEARCSKTLDEWLEMMKDDVGGGGGGSLHKQLVSNQVIGPELPFSPLVLIKFTWFKCGAMSIGLSFAHVLGDIFSLSDFFSILGQILSEQHPNPVTNLIKSRSLTKRSENPQPPSQDPVSVKWIDPVGDNWVTTNNCKMDMCSVHISPTQLSQLRSKISGPNEMDRFPSFECLCALFWKFIAQIRERPSPNRVTLCRKGKASPKKMMNVLSNSQVISVVEADFSMVMEGELKELATLLVNESTNEQTLIEQAVESDGGTSDLIVYGANLTFANWEEANLYGFELHGHKPVFVNYSIDSIGDGGVVLVLSGPPKDDDNDDIGQLGRIVTVILPENEMLELKSEMKKEGWCIA